MNEAASRGGLNGVKGLLSGGAIDKAVTGVTALM